MDPREYLFRFIIIGDTNVGKTCIVMRFTQKTFNGNYEPTIGVEFGGRTLDLNGKTLKIQIWDTAGQEAFKSITRSYYRGAIGGLLVYDITNKNTFKNIAKWLEETRTYSKEKILICLVGNKSDMEDKRQVSFEEGQNFARQNNLLFFETSAKNGNNVEETFHELAKGVNDMLEKGEIDPTDTQGVKTQISPFKAHGHETENAKKKSGGCC